MPGGCGRNPQGPGRTKGPVFRRGPSEAVAEGFEPSVTCATLAFEVCSCWSEHDPEPFNLVHSRTPVRGADRRERLWTGMNETETETERPRPIRHVPPFPVRVDS